ncbi:MAG: hypothetical protein OXI11_03860 [Gammaproteobacteria bacterium]|nr:hypothetical protein [Gammaproteobacteria bacterium]
MNRRQTHEYRFPLFSLSLPVEESETMPVSKHCGKKKRKPAAKKKSKPSSQTPSVAPDRRMMEKTMSLLSEAGAPGNAENALNRAQELIYDAWEKPRAIHRIRLAKRALKISDLCADAHSILAEDEARTLFEKREHYERAVAAGEKAVGRQAFKDDAGHFWGILETRPYMRAREALAHCLWECGERADAIGHLLEMLKLNPNDNQGVRYVLATWLLTVRDHDAAEALLQTYKNDYSANWHYSRTLLAFRNGDEPGSRRYLADAWEFNPHVPGLLIGAVEISLQLPEHYALGSPDEAVFYVLDDRQNWASTEGALPWLAEAIQTLPPPKKD